MTVLMKIRELQGESQQDSWEIKEEGEGVGRGEWLAIIYQNHQNRRRQTFLRRGDLSKVDIWDYVVLDSQLYHIYVWTSSNKGHWELVL